MTFYYVIVDYLFIRYVLDNHIVSEETDDFKYRGEHSKLSDSTEQFRVTTCIHGHTYTKKMLKLSFVKDLQKSICRALRQKRVVHQSESSEDRVTEEESLTHF